MIKKKEFRLVKDLFFSDKEFLEKDFEGINFDEIVKITSEQLILPALFYLLREKNYLNYLPDELQDFLGEIYNINKERNKALKSESKEISKLFKKKKIDHVFIKGAAYISAGLYPGLDRMIGDIDILVDKNDYQKSINELKKINYLESNEKHFFEQRHHPRLINPKKLFAVEIHRNVINKTSYEIDTNILLKNKKCYGGISMPCLNDQLKINILNFQKNDYGYEMMTFNFRSLIDSKKILENNEYKEGIKMNRIYNNYFLVAKKLEIILDKDLNFIDSYLFSLRFFLRYNFSTYRKVDIAVTKILIKIRLVPKQTIKFFTDRYYRKYLKKKLKKQLFKISEW